MSPCTLCPRHNARACRSKSHRRTRRKVAPFEAAMALALAAAGCNHPQPPPLVEPDVVVVLVGDAQSPCTQACAALSVIPCPQDAPTILRCIDACETAPLSGVSAFDAACVVRAPRTPQGVRACGARCLP